MSRATRNSSGWHAGERAVHARVGETALADRIQIGADLPPVAAEFLAEQTVIYVAATVGGPMVDEAVWVSPLTGDPGFARATGSREITVAARPPGGDPLAERLEAGARVGVLAIEPASRRRMRFNGRSAPTPHGFVVDLDQVYSNCPRFIQKRAPGAVIQTAHDSRDPVVTSLLTERQIAWLTAADTFVIGTADQDGNADASHRGGASGFVTVTSPSHFRFPDYAGNHMYMTLGNLEVRPRAGFLFVDWDTGAILQITGTARVEFDSSAAEAEFPDAARVVDVEITSVVESAGRMPAEWSAPDFSRFNPPASHPGGPN